jgi:NAD-dependent DNA ligase
MHPDIVQAIETRTFDALTTDQLIELLEAADVCYHNLYDSPLIPVSPLTDTEYDALRLVAQRAAPTHPYFIGVGSAVRGGKVKLPYTMGSLDQVYDGDFAKWVQRHNIATNTIIISDKLDGVSAMLIYDDKGALQIAYSRGDGVEGADITRHVTKIHNVPKKLRHKIGESKRAVVRAEIIISPKNFAKLQTIVTRRTGEPYKNPRNMVAGLMNSSDNVDAVYDYIDVVAYQLIDCDMSKHDQFRSLADNGFKVARHSAHTAGHMNDDLLTKLLKMNKLTTEYEIDGVVIEVDAADLRAAISPTKNTLNPAYAVKFKVADASNRAEPLVTGVSWAISKDGYLKPTIQIEPTDLVGVTIQNCTGFNAKFIQENGIGPGARIVLVRSGDVIPFCQSVVSPAPGGPQMPTGVDVAWTDTGVDLVLTDAASNDTVKFEQLLDFFNTIDVPHLGEGNLRPMFDAGFDQPEDVILLTQEDLSALVGSASIGKKIFTGMRAKLTDIPEYQLMGAHPAFGRGVGVRKMKKLWEYYKGELGPMHSAHFICLVDGFDIKTADKVVAGMTKYLEFKAKLAKVVTFKPYEAPKEGGLTGKTFVFTGFRSKELEQLVEAAGGKMGSSVSSKTSYVVADDVNSSSGKADQARKCNVPVITVAMLKEML